MSDWLVAISGTEAGARLALLLALFSAVSHALFGALQKGRVDPWTSRAVIDAGLVVISAPVALFLVPWPEGWQWAIMAGVVAVHFLYKAAIGMAYQHAAYTVVYPVMRGTGPLITVLAASVVFGESYSAMQWVGVACLSGGILLLALRNLSEETISRAALKRGLGWAVMGGVMVATYTTYDAWGIRQMADPFTFLAWFFFLSALDFPLIALARRRRWQAQVTDWRPLVRLGLLGAVVAWASFGGVMLATRLDSVGEAAVLRETSVVFAALIGWLALKETVGPRRIILMALIALGAVIVEMGG